MEVHAAVLHAAAYGQSEGGAGGIVRKAHRISPGYGNEDITQVERGMTSVPAPYLFLAIAVGVIAVLAGAYLRFFQSLRPVRQPWPKTPECVEWAQWKIDERTLARGFCRWDRSASPEMNGATATLLDGWTRVISFQMFLDKARHAFWLSMTADSVPMRRTVSRRSYKARMIAQRDDGNWNHPGFRSDAAVIREHHSRMCNPLRHRRPSGAADGRELRRRGRKTTRRRARVR